MMRESHAAKIDWGFLIDDRLLASVFPPEYSRFARPVGESLAVFLEGLPEERQAEVLAGQARLGHSADISQRLAELAKCCPVLHKLGQILARDERLGLPLRRQLEQLESLPATVSAETIEDVLRREFGPLQRRGIRLLSPPIAEASVAVVIGFEQAANDGVHHGVFKVLKPGIEQRLEQELELIGRVGAYLDERCDELGIPQLNYQETFEQVREKLQWEVRLDQEQQHLAEAYALYADDPNVQVPRLLDHCTPRVTAMERVTGGKVTNHRLDSSYERRRLARVMVQSLVARPIFCQDSRAIFHCDPHAGNLFLTADRRLAILDWSLVGRISENERIAVVQIFLAAMTLDAERIVTILEGLAQRPSVDRPVLLQVVCAGLRRARRGQLPGLIWLVAMLDAAVETAGLRVTADLMLLRKSLLTLEGVIAALGVEDSCLDEVLLVEFLKQFGCEWPWRWWTLPEDRRFATRISNADVVQTLLSAPQTAARYWQGLGLDCWQGVAGMVRSAVAPAGKQPAGQKPAGLCRAVGGTGRRTTHVARR